MNLAQALSPCPRPHGKFPGVHKVGLWSGGKRGERGSGRLPEWRGWGQVAQRNTTGACPGRALGDYEKRLGRA